VVGILQDKDRIFTNLYGLHDWGLEGAKQRGAWNGTREMLKQTPEWLCDQIKASGLTIPAGADAPRDVDGNGTMDAKGKVVAGWQKEIDDKVAALEDSIKKNSATVEANKTDLTSLKNQVDALGNTQQMEMLRLQGMTGKRNEAFDVMTNFIKKMQENRSGIIGNMR